VNNLPNAAVLRFEEPDSTQVQVAALRFAARRLRERGYLGAAFELEILALRVIPVPLLEFPDEDETVVCLEACA